MEEDMSNVLNKFQDILKEKNIDLNSVLGSSSSSQNPDSSEAHTTTSSEGSGQSFDFDINTILKMKAVFDKMNHQNNPRNNLLYSLKPFLREDKKEKLEQYIKISNMLSIIEILGNNNL